MWELAQSSLAHLPWYTAAKVAGSARASPLVQHVISRVNVKLAEEQVWEYVVVVKDRHAK